MGTQRNPNSTSWKHTLCQSEWQNKCTLDRLIPNEWAEEKNTKAKPSQRNSNNVENDLKLHANAVDMQNGYKSMI